MFFHFIIHAWPPLTVQKNFQFRVAGQNFPDFIRLGQTRVLLKGFCEQFYVLSIPLQPPSRCLRGAVGELVQPVSDPGFHGGNAGWWRALNWWSLCLIVYKVHHLPEAFVIWCQYRQYRALRWSFTFPFLYSHMVALFSGPGRVPVSRENLVTNKSRTMMNSARVSTFPRPAWIARRTAS